MWSGTDRAIMMELVVSIAISHLLIDLFTFYSLYVGISLYFNRYIVSHEYPTISLYFSKNTYTRYKIFVIMIIALVTAFWTLSVTAFGFIIWWHHYAFSIYNVTDVGLATTLLVLYLISFTIFLGIIAPIKLDHQYYFGCCSCYGRGCPAELAHGNTEKLREYVFILCEHA